jgi:ubiquinone/menaquinone biosynthesis C-methylase UbiE
MDTKVAALPSQADQKLQEEFNQWAAAGRGDEMEGHHSDITEQTLSLMDIQPGDRILDLGCGTGWASRRLARLAQGGEVVGLDVADEMLRRAEEASSAFRNVRYVWGSAERIPEVDNAFSKVLSVESFYYYADQGKALDELRRVMAPGGKLFILINLYKDNHYSLRWVEELKVPVQALSEENIKGCWRTTVLKTYRRCVFPIAAPHPRHILENGSGTPKN